MRSNTFEVYLDGIAVTQAYTGNIVMTAQTFGAYNSVLQEPFNGKMSEIRISDTARYTTNFSGNLQTEPFTDDANTLLLIHGEGDVAGSHNMQTNGNPELKTGKFDEAFYFDGVGDYLDLGTSDDWVFGNNDFTIDFWFNVPTI